MSTNSDLQQTNLTKKCERATLNLLNRKKKIKVLSNTHIYKRWNKMVAKYHTCYAIESSNHDEGAGDDQ